MENIGYMIASTTASTTDLYFNSYDRVGYLVVTNIYFLGTIILLLSVALFVNILKK